MPQLFLRTILVFMLFSASCFSQQQEFIKGKVLDSITKEPIVFATIRSKNEAIGVISNMDGTFSIPERFKTYGDTLEISSMGYKSREIFISTLSQDKAHTIYLRPRVVVLAEAMVTAKRKRKKKMSARQIVRRAIANISNNYPVHPFSTVGYYRDYQLKDKKYINLNEAILEVFDAGFLKPDLTDTKASIYDYRPNTDFERDTLADNMYNYNNSNKILDNAYIFNYGGNEFTILRVHDAIRNYDVDSYSYVNRLDQDLLNNHNFNKVESSYLRDEVLFKISFFKRNDDYNAFGTLYISPSDYAIHKMEYALYDLRKRIPDGVLNEHNTSGLLLFEVVTEYQKKEGEMYLNYISFHNRFQLLKQPEFLVDEVIFDSEKNRFEVKFNNEPEERTSLNNRNYRFRFKDKKIQFERIELFKKRVFLYPKLDSSTDREMFKQLAKVALFEKVNKELLKIDFDEIKDKQGSILNKRYYEDFNQYREFFVQQIKPNSTFSNATLYMDKSKPIFKDQPIVLPDNFDDYWMNTPLKTSDNAQENSIFQSISEKLITYSSKQGPEKTYIQTDKDDYLIGETIWHKTYLVDGVSHTSSKKSKVIYLELWGPNNTIVSKQKLYTEEYGAHGDIKLKDSLQQGIYTLRAYTKYMLNKKYPELYTKKISIWANQPTEHTTTFVEPNEAINSKQEKPLIHFFPEGGNLIYGIENVLGIKVIGNNGNGIALKGKIVDQNNKIDSPLKVMIMAWGKLSIPQRKTLHTMPI